MPNAFNMNDDEKEKQRREERRKSLATQVSGDDTSQSEEKNQKSEENSNKGVDFDQKNSYISDNDDDKAQAENNSGDGNNQESQEPDEEQQRLQSIVDKTFGGDPYKAVKSWREAQKSFSQMREEFQQVKAERDNINKMLNDNPELANLFKKAYRGELKQGENIQNFLDGAGESQYRDKPTSPSQESKLSPIEDVTQDTLVREGYIRQHDLNTLEYDQKQLELQRAKLKYLYDNLPNKMAEEASRKYQEQIAQQQKEAQRSEQRKKNAEINKSRYRQGIQKVVDDHGLDFAGKDRELLDEIDRNALHIVDPDNPYVMDEDAVILATQKVLRKHGRDVAVNPYQQKKAEVKDKEKSMYEKNTFNTNTRNTEQANRPQSIAEKMKQRRLEGFQRDMELRRKPKN